jgi:putative CocE/NonD family hydrolase
MPAPASYAVAFERNVAIPMRDGVILRADVYRPSTPGRYPTLLQRTPYNKASATQIASNFALRAAGLGYAVVVQDTRGRWASDGVFHTFAYERADGVDTCAWLVDQLWCNGRIGMFGQSYVGLTQWQAAIGNAPGLQALVPGVTASDYHDGWTYQGGAFQLHFNSTWATGLAAETAGRRRELAPGHPGLAAMIGRTDDPDAAAALTPLDADAALLDLAPYYREWLEHPTLDAFWDDLNVDGKYQDLDVPAIHVGGWYDIFLGGTIANYVGMRSSAKSQRARDAQRLLLGPWSHMSINGSGPIGSYWPGAMGLADSIDLYGRHLRFYDRHLRDIDNGLDAEPPVEIFVMGENRWRQEAAWPIARATAVEWFFGSAGHANSRHGDGVLLREPATGAHTRTDHYLSDPAAPVPTAAGQLCCIAHGPGAGVCDQRAVEDRADVLVYTSPAMTEPTEITGPVTAILYAASSAIDCDYTAKLVEVLLCGCARNLTDGIVRARYRRSQRVPSFISPGVVERYTIDLWATSIVLMPGHRLRVEIASSNFPRFDRNPQTGADPATTPLAEMAVAHQMVVHDVEHPSRIVVHVVPR